MATKSTKYLVNSSQVTLTDKEYKAAGGQAVVYVKGDIAYKIYHDPTKMIPQAKIKELSTLQHDDILAPRDVVFDLSKNPVGFTMAYVDGVEFLCKLFTKTFRKDNNLSPKDVAEMVVKMQDTLTYIHAAGFVVADYNEMNFLLSKAFDIIYHIDVDSWQTKHFPATAIMESVRDHKSPPGQFTKLTDWFSFAVVTFQMYTGIHPYKGMHPKYKPAEWSKRMDDGISVFDSKVKLPDTIQDFSVIPKKHMEWYKAIFIKNDRSIPPYPDGVTITASVIKAITSKGDFIVKLIGDYDQPIKNVYYYDQTLYVITQEGVYIEDKKMVSISLQGGAEPFEMCEVFNEKPLLVYLIKKTVRFFDLNKNPISSIATEAMMQHNGMIYTVSNGQLIENSFERMGKIIHRSDVVCDISRSFKMFRGIVIQDDFMKCRLVIPYERKKCTNLHIPELDEQRVIDAEYMHGICIIITEKKGDYLRWILCFNQEHNKYTIRQENVNTIHPVNFTVLPNKLCITVDDEKVAMFTDNNRRKELSDAPFDASMQLYHQDMKVLFVDDKKLYSVSMK